MAYQISEEEYKAIKEKEKQTRDKRISKRLRVLMLRYEGKSNPEISAKLDLSTDRLSHLISEYKRVGLDEYMRVKYQGNHRNMSDEEENEVFHTLDEVIERLCDTVCSLTPDGIRSITGRNWILSLF